MKLLGWRPSEKLSAMSWLHYHLYYQGKGIPPWGSEILKNCSKQVDGLRYAPTLSNSQSFLVYECLSCGHTIRQQTQSQSSKNTVADAV